MALRADEGRDKLREEQISIDPEISEWETHFDKPQVSIRQSITYGREPGTETSKYPRRKRNLDFQSSGERNGKSPNKRGACTAGCGLHKVYSNQ